MSEIIQKRVAAKAGNANADIVIPDNEQWEVLYGQTSLTTDATAANRRVVMNVVDENSNTIIDIHGGAVVPASQSNQHHEFMQGVFRESSFVGDALQIPIPQHFRLQQKWTLRVNVTAGVDGDSFTTNIVFRKVTNDH